MDAAACGFLGACFLVTPLFGSDGGLTLGLLALVRGGGCARSASSRCAAAAANLPRPARAGAAPREKLIGLGALFGRRSRVAFRGGARLRGLRGGAFRLDAFIRRGRKGVLGCGAIARSLLSVPFGLLAFTRSRLELVLGFEPAPRCLELALVGLGAL
jgi:hypothetical protein